ncbi:60S ribosomal protein L34 [Fukomys damarensis]|uniref:Large ribosomal subunit protein eL34 n=1 Tax=Fukomys damarensis TaxID=885580 RepID=A0A091DSS4_FUKDA|nr:60S ribosomal protein L34 [Fukomys damarensis]
MVQRLTYRRRLSYNTASNKTRLSRTPGNRIVYLYTKKVGKAPKSACGVCPGRLRGVRAVRPKVLMRLSKTKKHVSRAYGGSMCAKCVRDRIKRAFLIEEQKIVEGYGPSYSQLLLVFPEASAVHTSSVTSARAPHAGNGSSAQTLSPAPQQPSPGAQGIIYDVIVEPPSVGSVTDEHGHQRPVAFLAYRVNGQYIMEGLASSFLFTMGGLGFIILDRSNAPNIPKLNRFLLLFIGFVCVLLSFFMARVFMRMKLPAERRRTLAVDSSAQRRTRRVGGDVRGLRGLLVVELGVKDSYGSAEPVAWRAGRVLRAALRMQTASWRVGRAQEQEYSAF